MKLCKTRGSNERHFLLGAPASFEKNYTSREVNSITPIMLSSETILQRAERPRRQLVTHRGHSVFHERGPGRGEKTSAEHPLGTFPSAIPPLVLTIPCKAGRILPVLQVRKQGEVKQRAQGQETSKEQGPHSSPGVCNSRT